MPKDAPPNGGAVPGQAQVGPFGKVSEMQASFTVGRGPIPAAASMTCSTSCATRRR